MVNHSVPNQTCLTATPFTLTKQVHQPISNFPTGGGGPFSTDSFNIRTTTTTRKDKVVVVMGATGTGKSRLSVELATRFPTAEIVNSDKMQLYKDLNVVTNKVTAEERARIPHHLLGILDPDSDFTPSEFRWLASLTVEAILRRNRLPIIAGGSNSYIEALIDGGAGDTKFRCKYNCFFLWVDVSLPVLHSFVSERVDKMVEAGLADEVRGLFDPNADYSRGVRRAIGVPEMDKYLRAVHENTATRAKLLEEAVGEIKANTCKLACRQVQKIRRLRTRSGWDLHRLDATEVFRRRGEEATEAWEKLVVEPSVEMVRSFLHYRSTDNDDDRHDNYHVKSENNRDVINGGANKRTVANCSAEVAPAAVATAGATC